MCKPDTEKRPLFVVSREDFSSIFNSLFNKEYKILGPRVDETVIIYDFISSEHDLPSGFTDHQEPAAYSLSKESTGLLFNYNAGFYPWKRFLYPPRQKLWEASRAKDGFIITDGQEPIAKLALLGVLPCDLSAILIHDKIFMEGPYADPLYRRQRDNVFIIAANCARAGNNCFCTSMNTGPRAGSGFDLAFTEIILDGDHLFVFDVGSKAGADVLQAIPHREAGEKEIDAVEQVTQNTISQIGKTIDMNGIREILDNSFEHQNWDSVASRCLTCGNCTMVCPTCFCSSVEDTTDLTGDMAQRWRRWDSCFTLDFSYIAGGSIRSSAKSRYRQWMTHKLANWQDQFGMPGCTGCGRCITWCPVGIDITEEARIFKESDKI